MSIDLPTQRPGKPSTLALWVAAALTLILTICILLLPSAAPRAANGAEQSANSQSESAPASTNFGSATPSDRFVQSFQQQVTQQLQAAIEQAGTAHEDRLRTFEQQQQALGEQLQSIQQTIAAGTIVSDASAINAPPSPTGSMQEAVAIGPPLVNSRHPIDTDNHHEAPAGPISSLLPAAVSNLIGAAANIQAEASHADFERSGPQIRPILANVAPHGFVQGRLLNGVVATEGGPERESIVALTGNYQSANGFFTNLDGCFALVQGRPELAANRIDFKLSRLTCNFPNGASRTWDAAGWLVDSDGIRGVRAASAEAVGRKALMASAAGALAALGVHIGQSAAGGDSGSGLGLTSSDPSTGGATPDRSDRDIFAASAEGSLNSVEESLSARASRYGPSLQVGGGAEVTVVLANELQLPPSGSEISQTHLAAP